MNFRTTVELGGKTATGLPVPPDVLAALDGGKRPAVVVRIGAYTYRTTVGVMGGRSLLPLSAENRTAAGVAAGDEVDVEVALDTAPREVEVPDDLAAALEPAARVFFDGLTSAQRKEFARWIVEAKRPETRATRVARAAERLAAGQKTH